MRRAVLRATASYAVIVSALARDASAAPEDPVGSARTEIASVAREIPGVQTALIRARGAGQTPEQRLSNGELL
ncbi:MAG: hypothetical protein M3O50_07680, partial [Myxococcota bacterium]|nr:hypothetical protein [Myxococcota bacterium]